MTSLPGQTVTVKERHTCTFVSETSVCCPPLYYIFIYPLIQLYNINIRSFDNLKDNLVKGRDTTSSLICTVYLYLSSNYCIFIQHLEAVLTELMNIRVL